MKDFELVQLECCNYNGIGCDGINEHHFPTWFPDGMKPRAKCLIAEGKKCEFFRRTVLCEDCCQNPTSIEAENSRQYNDGAIASKPLSQEEWLEAREEVEAVGERDIDVNLLPVHRRW